MTSLRAILAGLIAMPVSAACAPALTEAEFESKLKVATASVLEVEPAAVIIINPQSTQTRRIWRAEVGGKAFDCDADRSFAVPDCVAAS